jgi:hypothetical protein
MTEIGALKTRRRDDIGIWQGEDFVEPLPPNILPGAPKFLVILQSGSHQGEGFIGIFGRRSDPAIPGPCNPAYRRSTTISSP